MNHHLKLSEEFIERVKNFKAILNEVETTPLDETLENFNSDTSPEKELLVWEKIAFAFQKEVARVSDLQEKKDILSILLALSMGIKDFPDKTKFNIQVLDDKRIKEIVQRYI